MKKIVAIIISLSLLMFLMPASAENSSEFVTVNNGKFVVNGGEYKALGACLYTAHAANYDYIERTVYEASANGITLIRAVDIWEGVYGQSDEALYSENVWKRVDYIIKVCGDYNMRVLVDISSLRAFLYNSPNRRDGYDPALFGLWDDVIEFMCNRRNTFTSVRYKDDPIIMSFAFGGEPVCYGGRLNDWSNGFFTSRSADDIKTSFFHLADTFKANAPNHLISAGGLLHITPRDSDGVEFYKSIWSYENIDYAAIHIYPGENDGYGEWANLNIYKAFCNSIGKPLIMEEFGDSGSDISAKEEYMSYCFDRCYENEIDVVVFWNWRVGSSFDIYSHMTGMMDILHTNARRLGFTGQFKPMANPSVNGQTLYSFEEGNVMFSPNTGDPGYGGGLSLSADYSSEGEGSLCVPVNFSEQYKWYWMYYTLPSSRALNGNYLAADVYLPEGASPLYAKFSINGSEQSKSGEANNFIIPGRWNTVYIALSDTSTSPEGCDFTAGTIPDCNNVNSLGLLFLNMNSIYTGNVYVDNIRIGELELFNEETAEELHIDDVTFSNNTITVSAGGGTGNLRYSYYILSDGKIHFSNAYTSESSIHIDNIANGTYRLRVYVQDSLQQRKVMSVTIEC